MAMCKKRIGVGRATGRLIGVCGILLLLSSGCGTGNRSNAPTNIRLQSDPTTIPIMWQDGFPTVETYLGSNGPYRFLVDTGAEVTTINMDCAREAQLITTPIKKRIGYGGGAGDRLVEESVVSQITLGNAVFRNTPADVMDISELGLDGILGFPVFADLLLTIDGPGSTIIVSREKLPSPQSDPTCLPLERNSICPKVVGTIAGKTALFKIDSGFNGTLFLPDGTEVREALNFEPTASEDRSVHTILGTTAVRVGLLKDTVEIGTVRLENTPTMLGMGRIVIGNGVLRQCVGSFDQRTGRVRLVRVENGE